MYVWAAAVAVAIAAGVWTATRRREPRASLAPQQAAGAALIGLFGWESLVDLPGSVIGYFSLSAGLGELRGLEAQQAFVVAHAAFVIAAGFAVAGILRRRTWGAVLGIGLAAAVVVLSALTFAQMQAIYAESMTGDAYFSVVASIIGMRMIPALAAVALLLWPLMRGRTRRLDIAAHEAPVVASDDAADYMVS
jgi:hypothetical protein